jgi:hypothetical protein
MPLSEKIVMGLLLFAGYWWLRARARSMNLEGSPGRVIVGVFGVLTALLMGEKALFDHYSFGPYTDLFLKAALAALSFAAIGFLFLRPSPPGADDGEGASPPG